MKSNRQLNDSMNNFIIGVIGIILTLILVTVLNKTAPQNQPKIDECYKEPTKEDIDWTGTKQDN
jgi:hypothetical protein